MAFTNPISGFFSAANVFADTLGFGSSSSAVPSTELVIEEKDPYGRRYTLRGRAMPYRGVSWGGSQHFKRQDYPGNPVATMQVLGSRESQQTKLNGTWKNKYIAGTVRIDDKGDGLSVIDLPRLDDPDTAEQAIQLFHRIRRRGKILRVSWGGEVRIGLLAEFTATYDRLQDAEWEMTFEWLAKDDDVALLAAESPPLPSTGFDLFKAIAKALAIVQAAVDLSRSFQATLVNFIKELGETVNAFVDAFGEIASLATLPARLLGALKAAAQSVLDNIESIRSSFTRRKPSSLEAPARLQLTTGSQDVTSPRKSSRSGATQKADAVRKIADLDNALVELRDYVVDVVASSENRYEPPATRQVTARAGETAFQIAAREYGSPDFANYVLVANNLVNARLPAGTVLKIPPRPIGATETIEPRSGGGKGC